MSKRRLLTSRPQLVHPALHQPRERLFLVQCLGESADMTCDGAHQVAGEAYAAGPPLWFGGGLFCFSTSGRMAGSGDSGGYTDSTRKDTGPVTENERPVFSGPAPSESFVTVSSEFVNPKIGLLRRFGFENLCTAELILSGLPPELTRVWAHRKSRLGPERSGRRTWGGLSLAALKPGVVGRSSPALVCECLQDLLELARSGARRLSATTCGRFTGLVMRRAFRGLLPLSATLFKKTSFRIAPGMTFQGPLHPRHSPRGLRRRARPHSRRRSVNNCSLTGPLAHRIFPDRFFRFCPIVSRWSFGHELHAWAR
jgi:hypothetical protein